MVDLCPVPTNVIVRVSPGDTFGERGVPPIAARIGVVLGVIIIRETGESAVIRGPTSGRR